MRFNAEAYEKCFPPVKEVEKVESAVETFKPTEEALKQEDEDKVEKMVEEVEVSEEGEEDGDRQLDNSDSE